LDVKNSANSNDGINFLLTVVDAFSRKAWVIPIKSKSGKNVSDALKPILSNNNFSYMQTDKGKEFYNSDVGQVLREQKVKHFSSERSYLSSYDKNWSKTLYWCSTKHCGCLQRDTTFLNRTTS